MTPTVLHADSRDALREMADASIDSCVTDPPYALVSIGKRFGADNAAPAKSNGPTGVYARAASGFMGKKWDTGETAFAPEFWAEVLRVLKPGGHLIAFGGTRTYHRLVCAIEDGGFEIRDQLAWLFGSGFPKSHDVSKGIDRTAGEWRGRAGASPRAGSAFGQEYERTEKGEPVTPEAQMWAGWGTALKPAHEPIVLARKPLIGTVASNVLQHGTGALNIDACRVETEDGYVENAVTQGINTAQTSFEPRRQQRTFEPSSLGRWPANVIHDGSAEVLAHFPETGVSAGGGMKDFSTSGAFGKAASPNMTDACGLGDSGSAARFFYTAKADVADRLESKHPTVKPVGLMAYLVKLVTPPGGIVLDPFAGSGATGMACMREGFQCILIEREAEYVADIKRRIAHVRGDDAPLFAATAESAT